MTALAWLLLFMLVALVPTAIALYATRPNPTRCACGQFKLPRAAACFDCTTR